MSHASIQVPLPDHFDFSQVMSFLTPRAVPGLESANEGSYARTFRVDKSLHSVQFIPRALGDAPSLAARSALPISAAAVQFWSQRVFDLSTRLAPFWKMVTNDPVLANIDSRDADLRLSQYVDPFEGLVRAILGQQVSVAGARTIASRLVQRFGEPAPTLGEIALRGFPTAQAIESAGHDAIRAVGLTEAKARCICTVARASLEGALDWEAMRRATPEHTTELLTALPGVGPWTASYVRMRVLGDRDAFPASDLGVLNATKKLVSDPTITPKSMARIAEPWRPWRAYATLLLWRMQ